MAHVFDYSSSSLGLSGSTYPDDLFFGQFYGAQAMPAEYWSGNGALNGTVRWIETDYSVSPPREYVVTGYTLLDAYGGDQVAASQADFLPIETLSAHLAETPAVYRASAGDLVLSSVYDGYSYGAYMAFSGIAAPARTLDAHPAAPYESYGEAGWGMRALAEAANERFRNDLVRLGETSLGDAGVITLRSWSDRPAQGDDFVLTYRPDAETKVTLGDLVDFGVDGNGYGQINPHTDLFRGEDVTMILTGESDYLTFNSFPARQMIIRMGDGDDYLGFGNQARLEGRFATVPQALTVDAGAGSDWIDVAVSGRTTLLGGGGEDMLTATGPVPRGAAAVVMDGGSGNDTLNGDQAETDMTGGAGDDLVTGGVSADTLRGGAGDDFLSDVIQNNGGLSRYFGGPGTLYGGGGRDDLWGSAGDDLIFGGTEGDTLWGVLGDDILSGGAGRDVYEWGTTYRGLDVPLGDDILRDNGGLISLSDFSPYSSVGADDMIRVGRDLIIGELGVSSLRIAGFYSNPAAWAGGWDQGLGPVRDRDAIDFAAARRLDQDARLGTSGDDSLRLDRAGTVAGGAGDDRITASGRRDLVFGDAGNDRIAGQGGDDTLMGGEGRDSIDGGAGRDLLAGNQGDDRLSGGLGNDRLSGAGGDDILSGGAGADILTGGSGDDVLRGGAGADRFEFWFGFETDRIADFQRGDLIILSSVTLAGLPNPSNVTPASLVQLFGSVESGSTVLDFGFGDRIIIDGVTNAALIASAVRLDDF